jgi:hypothetical protein
MSGMYVTEDWAKPKRSQSNVRRLGCRNWDLRDRNGRWRVASEAAAVMREQTHSGANAGTAQDDCVECQFAGI